MLQSGVVATGTNPMSTLSILMANYNYAYYVGGALRAILEQSYQPLEVIVIDDGSTDNSVEIIREFERRYPIVRLYCNERNCGVVPTANRALSLASGDYVYCAAADDRVLPGFFEKTMSLLAAHPRAGLCCSDPATFDHTGIINENPNRWSHGPCYMSPESLADVLKGGFIAGHTTIAKRSAMLEFEGFRADLKWACDWFLWLAIGFRYGVCYVPEALASFRRNPGSFSAVGERDREQQAEVLTRLLGIVRSPEHRDLLPYFARSGVFHHFGIQLPQLILSRPEHWNIETLMLLLFPLHEWSARMASDQNRLQANIKLSLQRLVPWVIDQCRRENTQRVSIFGCGSHTAMMLPLWQAAQGPAVERIIVTDPKDTWEFMGLPVTAVKDYRPMPGEGIVLSSYPFEAQMAETCRNLWPGTPYYPFYHPRPGQKSAAEPEPLQGNPVAAQTSEGCRG